MSTIIAITQHIRWFVASFVFSIGLGMSITEMAQAASVFDADVSVWDSSVVGNGTTLFPVGGSGQVNGNFVVDTNANAGVQTGIRASRRFSPVPLANSGSTYFAEAGESAPGLALWNFDFHIDLGAGFPNSPSSTGSLKDFNIFLDIDFDPAAGNTNVFRVDFSTVFPSTALLIQDSQNLGFNFWQLIGDPNILPFDPFAVGEYFFALTVYEKDTSNILARSSMTVNVVPEPTSLLLLGSGLVGILGWKFIAIRGHCHSGSICKPSLPLREQIPS